MEKTVTWKRNALWPYKFSGRR